MSWRDRVYLGTAMGMAVVPLMLMVFFLVRRKSYLLVTGWRRRAAIGGLVLGLVAAFPSPVFYIALELPVPLASWAPAVTRSLLVGLASGLLAIPLLAFARGQVRWLGIVSTVLCGALLYFTLLGLSE